jgi:peptidoglycan/LPS O-acetylase OafA/YrhL
MANSSAPPYRPDVDGLRAVAVLCVLLYHAFPSQFPAGFVGVDIFFVISGFLISGIIFGALRAGTFSFIDFYNRRIRRIFPALVIVCAACLAFGSVVLMPDEFRRLGKHAFGGAAFISNFVLLRESGYFDYDAVTKPLLHLWSLGIEEQYYLIWPAALYLLRNRPRGTSALLWLMGLTTFVLNLYYVYGTSGNASFAFYLPFTRFWELMIGSALAYHRPDSLSPRMSSTLSLLGAAGLGVSLVFINTTLPFPGWWALLVCLAAACFVAAGPTAWLNRTLLAAKPMVFVGLISYPLYLWHWPILSFGFIILGHPPMLWRAFALLASFLLAWLTYRYVERPIRRTTGQQGYRLSYALAVPMAVIALLAVFIHFDAVRPVSAHDPRINQIAAARTDWDAVDYKVVPGTTPRAAVFIGDSHMEQYWPRVEYLTTLDAPHRTVEFRTKGGCAPVPLIERGDLPCLAFVDAAFARAAQPDVDVVVLAASWQGFVDRGDYYRSTDRDRHRLNVLDPRNQWIYDGLANTLAQLRKAGKQVIVLTSSPQGAAFDPIFMVDRSGLTPQPRVPLIVERADLVRRLAAIDDRIRDAAVHAGAQVLNPDDWFCTAQICPTVDSQGNPLFMDATHVRASVVRAKVTALDQFVVISPAAG